VFAARPWAATLQTAGVVALVVALGAAPAGAAAADVVVKTGPFTGRLDITMSVGQSLVDFVGNTGRSQSRSVDFGLLGVLVTSHQCNGDPYVIPPQVIAPFTLKASSSDKGSEKGKTSSAAGTLGRQQVWATRDPSSRALTTTAPLEVQGLFEIAGGRAEAISRVIRGRGRESTGRVEISRLRLFGGVVELQGLRWSVVQRTRADGTSERHEGKFELAAATIGGAPVVVENRSLDDVLDQINKAIAYTGLALIPPRFSVVRGEARISALNLQLLDSQLAAATVRPAVAAAYPVRQPIADAIVSIECRSAVPIAVADLTLQSLGGSGGTVLQFGGATAMTEAVRYANPFDTVGTPLPLPGVGSLPPLPPEEVAVAPGALPPISGGAGAVGGGSVVPSVGGDELTSSFRTIPGGRGGAALLAGLLGLLGVLLMAGADYIALRRRTPT
jgi:hypothetical protein